MPKFLEEFGKHLLNVGTALIVIVILQPLIHGKSNVLLLTFGVGAYLSLIILSLLFFWFSDKLKK